MSSRWNIAVTGIGLVTPLGLTSSENVARVLRGESAPAVRPEVGDENGVASATVPPFEITNFLRNPKNLKLMSRPVRMALLAAREAIDQSGFPGSAIDRQRTGVYVGSGQTGIEYDEFFKALTLAWEGGREQDYKYLGGMPTRVLDRYFSLRTLSNAGVGAISTEFGARGPSSNYVQGEIAPAVAIYNACHDLMEERCDAAIVCGYESLLVPSMFVAYRKMELLSGDGFHDAYEPFNSGRPGLVLGEGAGCLFLERRPSADARGVRVIAEIDGVGLASQATDESGLTAGPDDLRAAAENAALPVNPDFVVARGLGTEADDFAEADGLRHFIPMHTLITALKGQTGYLGAATAAVELGIGLLCACQGLVPPVHGLTRPDDRIHLDFVRMEPARMTSPDRRGLFFSATFGGQVAAIAARAIPDQGPHG